MVHNKVIKYKCFQSGVRVIQSEKPEKQVRGISILRSYSFNLTGKMT